MAALKASISRLGRAKQVGIGVVFALILLGGYLWRRFGDHTFARLLLESPYRGRCSKVVTRAILDRSLELGTRYMLVHQKPEGNFDYEYDWREKTYSPDDNEVRQAGAVWGVALLYRDHPTPELAAAVEKGIALFDEHAVETKSGARCPGYGGKRELGIGTVALVALSYIEYLSAPGGSLAPDRRALHERRLAGYLKELQASMNPTGLWFGAYDPTTCAPHGDASPYSDGEALLALTKATRYANHHELMPIVLNGVEVGHRLNFEQALAKDADSDTAKSYYQWFSMTLYELATSGWPDTERFGDWLLAFTDWEIDVHKTLTRQRNTAYAYEGLIPAYDWAHRRNDTVRMAKYGCVIDLGLERLISWQVGGPLATRYTSDVDPADREAIGGVQNERDLAPLRIDVTQHQMHATIYARQLIYTR
ncbi:MAG TPA: hypothetical protein VMI54_04950 [Polyangiaceae bacterium]|nr:hypothetical protein [Polyangiaceae bacterium]